MRMQRTPSSKPVRSGATGERLHSPVFFKKHWRPKATASGTRALVQKYGWETVPVTLLIAYVLFGIEEIGVEIEDPFGSEVNDLPLEQLCEMIEQNLREIADSVA